MSTKLSKKISSLNLNASQVIPTNQCSKLKGGGYYCCVRNKWISTN